MPKVVQDYRNTAKKRILDSSTKLFYERGYNNASMDDIAKDIGVTKGTLYLYFKNKEEILDETCRINISIMENTMGRIDNNNFISSIRKFFEEELNQPDHIKFYWVFALSELNINPKVNKIIKESYANYKLYITKIINQIKDAGILPAEINPADLAMIFIAFHNGIMISTLQGMNKADAISMFSLGVELILKGANSRVDH